MSGPLKHYHINVTCPPMDDQAAWERVFREMGTAYHPRYGGTLLATARPWMDDVRRFYGRNLRGVDLCRQQQEEW